MEPTKTELWISRILRGGLIASASMMVLGLLLYVTGNSPALPESNPPPLEIFKALVGASQLHLPVAVNLMYGGLVLLILTPFLRVLTTIAAFFQERDWKFVLIATAVFAMLVGELFVAFR